MSGTTFDDVRDLYQEVILERGRAPRHSGKPEQFDASARGDNPLCGDRVEVFVRRRPDGSLDGAPRFVARGCAVSIASADLMADAVADHDADTVRDLAAGVASMTLTGDCPCPGDGDPAIFALRSLSAVHAYPSRRKCVTLPWSALVAALDGRPEASDA